MNNSQVVKAAGAGSAPANWSIAGVGDFNGDGKSDILWHDTSGNVGIWDMKDSQILKTPSIASAPSNWSIAGVGDFNGDGKSDIVWQNDSWQRSGSGT